MKLFKKLLANFIKHDVLTLSAALAFYTALSLAPLLLVTLSIFSILGYDSQVQIIDQIETVLGNHAGAAVSLIIEGANKRPDLSKLGGIVALVTLFFSASAVFAQLQNSLNFIWEVPKSKQPGWKIWLKHRTLSIGMVAALGIVGLASTIVTAVISFIFQNTGSLWINVSVITSLCIFTGLFASFFKVLPDRSISWRDSLIGGGITAVLFTIGKQIIGAYLGKSAVGSAYGAAGSLILFLVWVYYSAVIIFLGAEVTALLSFESEYKPKFMQRGDRNDS